MRIHTLKIKHAKTEEAFMKAIGKSQLNDFLLTKRSIGGERPLKYTLPATVLFDGYTTENFEYLYIQKRNGQIIANLTIRPSRDDPSAYQFMEISVHTRYKNRGLAKRLLKAGFAYAQEQGMNIEPSSFSGDGEKYLRHVLLRMNKDFPDVKLTRYGQILSL